MVVLVATTASWAVSLPISFGFVYGSCAPACLGSGLCIQLYVCRDAWSYFSVMMFYGAVAGIAAGGIGYAYRAPRKGSTVGGDRGARIAKKLLAPFPFVLLGAAFYVILLPGLNLLVGAWTLLLGSVVSIAVASVAIAIETIPSRPT